MSTTLLKNTASQRVRVYAYTPADGKPKTGDAANLTAYIAKDYGAVTALTDTSATEEDATNAPGYYWFDITQTETNADNIMVTAKSASAGVYVLGAPAIIGTRPATGFLAPATPGRTLVVDANGLADANAVKVGPSGSGTTQTAGDIIGDTNDIQTRLPAALVGGRMDSSVGAMAANVLTAAATAADFGTEIAAAVWDAATTGLVTAGSIGKLLVDKVDTVLSTLATAANQTTILNRLGAWTGSGLNTVLGAMRAIAAKAAALTPTDISTGTTFDNTTDSTEAIRDRGDAAWVTGAAGTQILVQGVWTKSGSTYYVSFVATANGAIIAGASLSALSVTFTDEDGTDLTFSGTPAAAAGGTVYASGTLGTAITNNLPVIVKVGFTYSATAYSFALPGAQIA